MQRPITVSGSLAQGDGVVVVDPVLTRSVSDVDRLGVAVHSSRVDPVLT